VSLLFDSINDVTIKGPIGPIVGHHHDLDLHGNLPVARSSTEFGVVFDFWLSATGPNGGHTPVGEGEGDHLTGAGGGKHLRGRREGPVEKNIITKVQFGKTA